MHMAVCSLYYDSFRKNRNISVYIHYSSLLYGFSFWQVTAARLGPVRPVWTSFPVLTGGLYIIPYVSQYIES